MMHQEQKPFDSTYEIIELAPTFSQVPHQYPTFPQRSPISQQDPNSFKQKRKRPNVSGFLNRQELQAYCEALKHSAIWMEAYFPRDIKPTVIDWTAIINAVANADSRRFILDKKQALKKLQNIQQELPKY